MSLHEPHNVLRFGAKDRDVRQAVVLLHGRGSSPRDIAGLTRLLPQKHTAYFAPAANHGTWYPQRFLAPIHENEPDLSSALELIGALVTEIEDGGLDRSKIGLIGFSQGACLALEYAARNPSRYAFIGGLSGALIGPLGLTREPADLKKTPILLGCAERDGHIPLEHVQASGAILSHMKAEVTTQIYPGDAHTVFPDEISWLKAHMTLS